MTLSEFIRKNQAEIDRAIRSVVSNADLDNNERENWILNDEGLYSWALNEGVTDI